MLLTCLISERSFKIFVHDREHLINVVREHLMYKNICTEVIDGNRLVFTLLHKWIFSGVCISMVVNLWAWNSMYISFSIQSTFLCKNNYISHQM